MDAGFDLRVVCRELARLTRDLMVVKIDPSRIQDPEIASESERERLQALAARSSREDLMRAFDLLATAEADIRVSSQPRHAFEMALVKWVHLRQLTPLADLIKSLGGAGALQRLIASDTAPSSRLAAAAKVPLDTLLAQWLHNVRTRGTAWENLTPGLALIAIVWIVAIGALSLRISR